MKVKTYMHGHRLSIQLQLRPLCPSYICLYVLVSMQVHAALFIVCPGHAHLLFECCTCVMLSSHECVVYLQLFGAFERLTLILAKIPHFSSPPPPFQTANVYSQQFFIYFFWGGKRDEKNGSGVFVYCFPWPMGCAHDSDRWWACQMPCSACSLNVNKWVYIGDSLAVFWWKMFPQYCMHWLASATWCMLGLW